MKSLQQFKITSLRDRILLMTLAGFLITSITLVVLVVSYLNSDAKSSLIQQQQSMVNMVVQRMENALQERVDFLEQFTLGLSHNGQLLPVTEIQQQLNRESHLQHLFNGGLVVLDATATSIADYPVVADQTGIDFSTRNHIKEARQTKNTVITRPLIGEGLKTPLFAVNTPILSDANELLGFVLGVNVLANDNVLKRISQETFGADGQLLIIDPNLQIYVTNSDQDVPHKSYIEDNSCGCITQVLEGHVSGITTDGNGKAVLFASAEIKQMGWLVIRTYPLELATNPIDALTVKLALMIIALMLFMALVIAYLVTQQLTPLKHASKTIKNMATGQQPAHELNVVKADEVGNLIESFNALHKARLNNEHALGESEERYRLTMEATGTGIWSWDIHRDEIIWNSQCYLMLGYQDGEFKLNQQVFKSLLHPDDRVAFYINFMPQLQGNSSVETEFRLKTKQGGWLWIQSRGRPILFDRHSKPVRIVGTHVDIDKQKQTEQLRLAAAAFETNDAIMIVDADDQIIKVNNAFSQITGYSQQESIGQQSKLLHSGVHDDSFYEEMSNTLDKTGHWQGEVWNRRKDGQIFICWLHITTAYTEDGAVNSRVAVFSDITEKKKSEELIWKQANFDLLTGLPNRRMFFDRLSQEIKLSKRAGKSLALMFLDLDHFKEVNDTLGHAHGDKLLKEASIRLKKLIRGSDTVARLGGDEFTVILPQIDSARQVELVADKLLKELASPFQLGEHQVTVSASIGATLYPQDAKDSDQLIKNADQAMYAAKNSGRNQMHYFTQGMQEAAINRLEVVDKLRKAIKEKQFQLYYQPIIDMKTGASHKAEALIRWLHPEDGLIMPDEFISIAEENGLISDIGNWTFKEALNQVTQWRQNLDPQFQISINTSPTYFEDSNTNTAIMGEWLKLIKDSSTPGDAIAVEITEALLMDSSKETKNKLLCLRDANIQVALDDFGTGHSSLAYLKRFNIDYLKIDRCFIRNLHKNSDDMALCTAMIVMAHTLGLKVIAEGIETEEQRSLLTTADCDYAQGFLYSRPLPAGQFEQCIRDFSKATTGFD